MEKNWSMLWFLRDWDKNILNHHWEKISIRILIVFRLIFFISEEVADPTYITSKRGHRQLTHNGFKFTKDKTFGKHIRYRCLYKANARYICKARASTYEKDGIERALFSGTHNHPPTVWEQKLSSWMAYTTICIEKCKKHYRINKETNEWANWLRFSFPWKHHNIILNIEQKTCQTSNILIVYELILPFQ